MGFFRRRSWIWLLLVVFVGICVFLIPREARFDRSKIKVRFERWMEPGDGYVAITNGTNQTVLCILDQDFTLMMETIEPKLTVKVPFAGTPPTLTIYVHPWTLEEREETEKRYQKYPKIIREWLMRRYSRTNPNNRYTVTLPPRPPVGN